MNKILILLLVFSAQVNAQTLKSLAEKAHQECTPYYTSLTNADIDIRIRKKGSAMSASYSWWSIFRKPEKRQYYVNVNEKVAGTYVCFQFDQLSPSSQIGVWGHELAHIEYFHSLNFWGFIRFILNQANFGGITKSERQTDYRTIKNGLGRELRSWSLETRTRYQANNRDNKDMPTKFSGRYLNPSEIDSVILLFPTIYKK